MSEVDSCPRSSVQVLAIAGTQVLFTVADALGNSGGESGMFTVASECCLFLTRTRVDMIEWRLYRR